MSLKKEIAFLKYLETNFEKENVSISTMKSYISILKNVRKGLNYKGTTLHFTKNIDKVEEYVSKKSTSYRISTYSAIIKILKNKKLKELYVEKINDINKEQNEKNREGLYTEKERKTIGVLTFSDLQKIIPLIKKELDDITDKQSKLYYITYQYYIISVVYLKCKFLCRLDWCNIRIITDKTLLNETDNQLLLEDEKMKIIFNQFKNKKSIGSKEFEICDDVCEKLKKWILFSNDVDKDNLFYNKNKSKAYDCKRFSELIKRMFLKYLNTSISANHIRKLKENELRIDPEYLKMNLKEREQAHLMNFHGKATAEIHYQKK